MADINEKIILSKEDLEKIAGGLSDRAYFCFVCKKCGKSFVIDPHYDYDARRASIDEMMLETEKNEDYDTIHKGCGGIMEVDKRYL